MDCGPSLGVLTLNALAAADEVFIPLQPHFLALHGLSKLLETTALVARRINPKLTVTGVVLCLYDAATKLAQEVVNDLVAFLDQSRGANVPWANARVFDTKIRRNIKLAECPSFGKSIFGYAPKSPGAADYAALADEVLAMGGKVDRPGEGERGRADRQRRRWRESLVGVGRAPLRRVDSPMCRCHAEVQANAALPGHDPHFATTAMVRLRRKPGLTHPTRRLAPLPSSAGSRPPRGTAPRRSAAAP